MNEADLGSWFPTHFAKCAKWMGHGAGMDTVKGWGAVLGWGTARKEGNADFDW